MATALGPPSSDRLVSAVIVIIGIGIMTVIAGISDNVGKILLVIMAGFLMIWLLSSGDADLKGWLGKL